VAAELLATSLGVPLLDFAWSGATTGVGNHLDPGGSATTVGENSLPGMMALYSQSATAITPIASSALFLIWGGPDDFLSPSPLDPTPIDVANRAAANIASIASGLQGIGARHILVSGMPDLGLTPWGRSLGSAGAAELTALTDYFNSRLVSGLPPGVMYLDTAALLRAAVANPAAYGFTNVTDMCFNATVPSICAVPSEYLFWDDLHPSARGHEILARAFAAQAIPEPSTFIVVVGLAAIGLGASRGRVSRTAVVSRSRARGSA
jgi:phospholipase/lecithinase/hemolysin